MSYDHAPVFLFASVFAIALFSYLSVAVWSRQRRHEREAYYRSETVKRIAESQSGGSAAVEFLRENERIAERRRREGQKLGGLITVAVGIGMTILVWGVNRGEPEPVYLVGLIPVLIGLALLSYAYFLAPKTLAGGDADVSKR